MNGWKFFPNHYKDRSVGSFGIAYIFGFHIIQAIGVLYSATPSFATDQSDITELDPIIVSASALPTPLAQTPANVTVITRTDIEHQHAHRLSEVFRQVAGLHVDEMSGRGGITSVYLRGGDPNFTLIMIDGVPMNDPTNQRGGSVDLSTLTPERIERIEILRGPLSALYGSEAVSGVINIITQSGSNESQQRIRAAGGRFGFTRELLQTSGPIGPTTYALSFSHTRNDEQVEADRFALGTVGWNVKWRDNFPFSLMFTGQFTRSSTRTFPEGSGGARLAILRDTERRKTYELVSGLQLTHHPMDDWQHTFSINFFRRTQDTNSPGVLSAPSMVEIPPNTSDTTYTRIQPRWQHTINLIPDWTLTGGVQLTTEIGTQRGRLDLTALGLPSDQPTNFQNTRSTGALFSEVSAKIYSDIHVTGGIRLDIPEGFMTTVSPRVAMSYQATSSTRVRVGYGEGFKLPSMASLGDPTIGNPQLKPETSQGWDVGIKQNWTPWSLELELSYFRNRFSKLIDLDPSLARTNVFRLVNLQTVTTQGIEFSTHIEPFTGFSVKGFVTYLDSKIQGTSDSLRNRPKWSGGIILLAEPSASWTFRTQIRAVGTRIDLQIPTQENQVGGYIKADLAISYRPTTTWRIFGILENVTNATYEEFLGFPAPPITFKFGLEYSP